MGPYPWVSMPRVENLEDTMRYHGTDCVLKVGGGGSEGDKDNFFSRSRDIFLIISNVDCGLTFLGRRVEGVVVVVGKEGRYICNHKFRGWLRDCHQNRSHLE